MALTLLQAVDVLRVHSEQQALLVQHADEVVSVVWPVASGVQFFCQGEEGPRVVGEEVDVEDGFREGGVVPLEVCVQPSSGGSLWRKSEG